MQREGKERRKGKRKKKEAVRVCRSDRQGTMRRQLYQRSIDAWERGRKRGKKKKKKKRESLRTQGWILRSKGVARHEGTRTPP